MLFKGKAFVTSTVTYNKEIHYKTVIKRLNKKIRKSNVEKYLIKNKHFNGFFVLNSACRTNQIPNIANQNGWHHPTYPDIVFPSLGCLGKTFLPSLSLTFSKFSKKNPKVQTRL